MKTGTTVWTILFVLAGTGLALLGSNLLTQATLGVGVIALGIFVAVLARIIQAGAAHAHVAALLTAQQKQGQAPTP